MIESADERGMEIMESDIPITHIELSSTPSSDISNQLRDQGSCPEASERVGP